jgi:hypothetical protein
MGGSVPALAAAADADESRLSEGVDGLPATEDHRASTPHRVR